MWSARATNRALGREYAPPSEKVRSVAGASPGSTSASARLTLVGSLSGPTGTNAGGVWNRLIDRGASEKLDSLAEGSLKIAPLNSE